MNRKKAGNSKNIGTNTAKIQRRVRRWRYVWWRRTATKPDGYQVKFRQSQIEDSNDAKFPNCKKRPSSHSHWWIVVDLESLANERYRMNLFLQNCEAQQAASSTAWAAQTGSAGLQKADARRLIHFERTTQGPARIQVWGRAKYTF